MRGNRRSTTVGLALACVEAASLIAVWRSTKRSRLLDDEEARHFDMGQSIPRAAPMQLVHSSSEARLRRAAR